MTRFIGVDTDRWREICAVAKTLRNEGELTYVNLKAGAKCCGDVAQRVMKAMAAEQATSGALEASASPSDSDPAGDTLPEPVETEWVEQVDRLKRIVLRGLRRQVTFATNAHDADVTRFRAVEQELRMNLAAALDDVAAYSAAAAHVEDLEAQVAALEQQAVDATTASEKAVADLSRALDGVQGELRAAETALTDSATARIRAETTLSHLQARAESAEREVTKHRTELVEMAVHAARLEGQLEGLERSRATSATPVPLAPTPPTEIEIETASTELFAISVEK